MFTLFALSFSGVASAHVVVKPAEVVRAGFQTFNVSVPNEGNEPTTSVKLVLPSGLKYVSVTTKPGWKVATEKDGAAADANITSITWSGGKIEDGFRDDFSFSAQVPASETELQWKAYQTYADGQMVSWDQAPKADNKDETATPFSVTKVVALTGQTVETKRAEEAANSAKSTAQRAIYVSVASLIVSLVAIAFATRKR